MSADNYNYIDYHEGRDKPWSVSMGFMSNDETPEVSHSTAWFTSALEAISYAASDWTEYGEEYSARALEQMRRPQE